MCGLGFTAWPAHPHVCGEHISRTSSDFCTIGSSPRVWGAHHPALENIELARLIPTCVGSTFTTRSRPVRMSAHPHVCGEHSTTSVKTRIMFGSSPRVWGARKGIRRPRHLRRLIPTCVGSTGRAGRKPAPSAAHPHVCGEHCVPVAQCQRVSGSSPRVWGAPRPSDIRDAAIRLIPTCVGSTLADMGFYPHTPSFRISLEPKASINPTRFLGLSPSGSAPIPASFAPPFSWP